MMRNSGLIGNTLVEMAAQAVQARLPQTWRVTPVLINRRLPSLETDGELELVAPDGSTAILIVEAKASVSPRQAADLAPRLREAVGQSSTAGAILTAPYVSKLARERLREAGISYLDQTGNIRITLENPALYIETEGAEKDPSPPRRPVQSLKGAKAARLVRALCDWRPPVGTRELARRAGTDAGYTSRVLAFLEAEDLVRRKNRGKVTEVNWRTLLERWAQDYSVTKTNRAMLFLAPRGLSDFTDRLRKSPLHYALTGSLAVPEAASVAPARLASCYVRGAQFAGEKLGLRQTGSGSNVILLEPFDDVVFQRSREANGLVMVAPPQCAVDLLTGSGREPSEADSLMTWMAAHESEWRA